MSRFQITFLPGRTSSLLNLQCDTISKTAVPEVTKPRFFATPVALRTWFEKNHERATELWVGFHKRHSGKPSVTWPESVDAALCFGWIDGVRKSLDQHNYAIRFTPRKPGSTWSEINIGRVHKLNESGLMRPAGQAAFEKRDEAKSRTYSYEQRNAAKLAEEHEQRLRSNKKAWEFFQAQPAWYRRVSTFWVVSAKKDETRQKRLGKLIEDSEAGRTILPLTRKKG